MDDAPLRPGTVGRRSFLKAAAGASSAPLAAAARRPNILYIHSHDTGRYIQPYGQAVPTPNLQRLAGDGVVFRQAFSAAPTCSPSRAALLTGQCPHSAGIYGLANRGFFIADFKQHLLHTLRRGGYYAALAGLQHIAPRAEVIGFDSVIPCKSVRAEHVGPAAAGFLRSLPRQPFFLDVGFFETHRKFHEPGPAEDPRYCAPPAPIPDCAPARYDWAGFKASARVLDDAIGLVLDTLARQGLAESTLVIYTTDHGVPFPEMKCNLTDHGTGVALILRGPGGFSGGKVCDAMISQIDLFPTLCELAGVERPAWLEGRSILPVVRGEREQINDEIFAEVTYHAAYEPQRAVRTHRWKYVRRFSGRKKPVIVNCDDGPSRRVWLDYGWRDRAVDPEQLYDLVFDPAERHNVVADPDLRPVVEEMRGRLDRWMRRTNDPLLKGPVPAPSGASYNDPDALLPGERLIKAP
jgi:N-sulfoglucosamine sulfohydrolase